MSEIMITLNAIRAERPCEDGWVQLLTNLRKTQADDEPLPLVAVLDSNGLEDALWCLDALPAEFDGRVRLLACAFAERALRFFPAGEEGPRAAIETARRFARGEATREELAAARAAVMFSSYFLAADAALAAAADAIYSVHVADAARFAATANAAYAADDADDAELNTQAEIFRAWCASGGEITDPAMETATEAA